MMFQENDVCLIVLNQDEEFDLMLGKIGAWRALRVNSGGNQVDGLPLASSFIEYFFYFVEDNFYRRLI